MLFQSIGTIKNGIKQDRELRKQERENKMEETRFRNKDGGKLKEETR